MVEDTSPNKLPKAENPIKLNEELLASTLPTLEKLEINRGCGKRPCQICSNCSPSYKGSMPFNTITTLFDFIAIHADQQKKDLYFWHMGDPIYYQDGEKSLADVYLEAKKKNIRIADEIDTHGFLAEETQAKQATEKIIDFCQQYPQEFSNLKLNLSIDRHGWLDENNQPIPEEKHQQALVEIFKLFKQKAFDKFQIFAHFDSQYSQQTMVSYCRDLFDKAGYSTLETANILNNRDQFSYTEIKPQGRMKGIMEASNIAPEPFEPFEPYSFSVIDYEGDVLYHGYNSETQSHTITHLGSIYTLV